MKKLRFVLSILSAGIALLGFVWLLGFNQPEQKEEPAAGCCDVQKQLKQVQKNTAEMLDAGWYVLPDSTSLDKTDEKKK